MGKPTTPMTDSAYRLALMAELSCDRQAVGMILQDGSDGVRRALEALPREKWQGVLLGWFAKHAYCLACELAATEEVAG